MSRLNELIAELCPNGVEYRAFGESVTIVRGASPRPIKNFITTDPTGVNWIKIGDVKPGDKYITASAEKITQEGAKKSRIVKKGDFILSNSMSFGRPYILQIDGCIHDGWLAISDYSDSYLSDFLYHLLNSNSCQSEMRKKASFGGAVQNLNADIVRALVLPVPPLEVQREIVRVLDYFTLLTAELTDKLMAEFTARKKQYEFYRDRLLTFDPLGGEISEIAWKKLGEICDIISGFPFDSTQFCNSGVKLLRGMNVKRGFLDFSDSNNKYWRSIDGVEKYLLRDGDIIVAMDGSLVGKSFGIVSEKQLPLLLVQRVARVRAIQGNVRYIYHCISGRFSNYVDIKKTEGAVPHISLKDILNFQIPFPELQIQNRIAHVLDNFNAICTDLNIGLPAEIEDRQKQYEYYRDKLLSFKEVSESIGK